MWRTAGVAVLVALLAPATAGAETVRAGSVYARVTPTEIALGNALAERRWSRASFRTVALVDKRGADRPWSAAVPDFSLRLAGADAVSASDFSVPAASVQRLARGGLRVTMELAGSGLAATRTAEAYPGVAGFRTQTVLRPPVPLALGGAVLERAATGSALPSLTALRAGADWREPDWQGPQAQVGDPHAGTWRDTRDGARGAPLAGGAGASDRARGARFVAVSLRGRWRTAALRGSPKGVR